jgi:isopentenyl-diphosphate delta-isomerase
VPQPNPEEVEDYKWMPWAEFMDLLKNDDGDAWSWWCKDQLKQLKDNKLFNSLIINI